jgi:hypothetical protein
MRRKRSVVGSLGAAAVLGTILVAWFVSASAASAPAAPGDLQIQVLDHEGPFEKEIDLGKPGSSSGDMSLGTHQLFDAADPTLVVGRDFERLVVLRLVSGGEDLDFIYDSTIRLAGGDITLYGEGRYSDIFTSGGTITVVTGGTGIYRGMEGTGTITATATEGEFLITLDLVAG